MTPRGASCHPVQASMVDHYGSQCGYCTPGFVASLFEAYYRKDCAGSAQISDQLCGNLCRCTGYRPIRDAALGVLGPRDPAAAADDPFQQRLKVAVAPLAALDYAARLGSIFPSVSLARDSCPSKSRIRPPRLVAGATESRRRPEQEFGQFPLLISTRRACRNW